MGKNLRLGLGDTGFINTLIDERFCESGIEIPYPQMDVHLKKQ